MEGNELTTVPSGALAGLRSLRELNLGSNRLTELNGNSFPSHIDTLSILNLTDNRISSIKDGSFGNLINLKELYLTRNTISELSVGTFRGSQHALEILDLGQNFLEHVPTEALSSLRSLRRLVLTSNNIQTLEEHAFADLGSLEVLDLSRNSLANLNGANVFSGLLSLRSLNVAYNVLRKLDTMDEAIFLPLHQLEVLDLTDNQLMNLPTVALNGLPGLRKLFLDYNKIGVLSEDSLSTVTNLDELSLAYNLLHDLPDSIFAKLANLRLLNLHGNKIDFITQSKFDGVAENLLGLDVGFNDLLEIPKLELPRLMILNLAMNQFTHIKPEEEVFENYGSLRHLNISFNQLSLLPSGLFKKNKQLEVVDMQGNLLDRIEKGVFQSLNMTSIVLKSNRIKELGSGAFEELPRLRSLDLSDNELNSVKNGAFDQLLSLRKLDLSNNRLTSFKGDFFTTRTRVEELHLSSNLISYLYPNSFIIHRRLKTVDLSHNKLSYFPAEILTTIRSLQKVDLSYNKLQSVETSDFSNMPRLKTLNLAGNEIGQISGTAFKNSSSLTNLDLSDNRLIDLDESTFKGLARLKLNLAGNELEDLPGDIFNRRHVFALESVDLSRNALATFPADALRKQYSCLEWASLASNKITSLPVNSDVLVNVKYLDLSENPLSPDAQHILFSEPKSTRFLNVANIGIVKLPTTIEMPFLKSLNLSDNRLTALTPTSFERTSLLRELDLSRNKIQTLNVQQVWLRLASIRKLDISQNPILLVSKNDLDPLVNLEVLDISRLRSLAQLECEAFGRLDQLRVLGIYGYPSLNFFESQECLGHLSAKLESLAIELKEPFLQGHLQKAFSPRITQLTIVGSKLSNLSPSALAGMKAPKLAIRFINTSISNIPAHIFAPLPLSTHVDLKLERNNEISSLDGQLVNALDSKQMTVRIDGLRVVCNCKLEPVWRWINERMRLNPNVKYYNAIDSNLTCSAPKHLYGQRVADLDVEQLQCQGSESRQKSTPSPMTSTTVVRSNKGSFTEFRVDASETVAVMNHPPPGGSNRRSSSTPTNYNHQQSVISSLNRGQNYNSYKNERSRNSGQSTGTGGSTTPGAETKKNTLTKVDTMIIGIVAGVVAFVCILILIICVIRLKSTAFEHGHQHAHGGCTCKAMPVPHAPHPGHSPMGAATVYNTVASRAGHYRAPMPSQASFYGHGAPPTASVRPVKLVPTYGHAVGRNMASSMKSQHANYYMYSEDDR